jgi:hypothetical protein
VDVAVTEVGREIRQLPLRVDALAVPLEHPVDDEGVPQVVDARTAPAWCGLEAGCSNHAKQELLGGDVGVAALRVAEQRCFGHV